MSFEEISIKHIKKCRKVYKCIWCGEQIEIGQPSTNRTYIFHDHLQRDKCHPECYKCLQEIVDIDDGFIAGDYFRGSTETREDR